MVLAYSDRISPVPPYSSSLNKRFRIQDYHLLWLCFPNIFYYSLNNFGAAPISLATTLGITNCSLFLCLLRCFSSAGYLHAYARCHIFNMTGFPIRTSTDQNLFAAPRSLSQLTTSFVVSESLGIHHTPFVAS